MRRCLGPTHRKGSPGSPGVKRGVQGASSEYVKVIVQASKGSVQGDVAATGTEFQVLAGQLGR